MPPSESYLQALPFQRPATPRCSVPVTNTCGDAPAPAEAASGSAQATPPTVEPTDVPPGVQSFCMTAPVVERAKTDPHGWTRTTPLPPPAEGWIEQRGLMRR